MKYIVKTNNPYLADIERYSGIETENAREAAEYMLENAGGQFEDEYDEMLDECYGEIEVCGYSYAASVALYRIDKTAYECGMNDYNKPCLMTIEEAEKADVCYVEYIYDKKIYPAFVNYKKMEYAPDYFKIIRKDGQAYKRPERLNKDFRLWDAKPTAEQMHHAKWEE